LSDGAFVEEAKASGLAAEENVVSDGERGNEIYLLVNRADAGRFGFAGRARIDGATGEFDGAAIRGINTSESLDESGFAGAILAHKGVDFTSAQGEVHAV
jgi:hypothetical protein